VIRLPKDVLDPATGTYVENYAFHHYEVFRSANGKSARCILKRSFGKEVEYLDFSGKLGGCAFWGIYDLDAAQYQPTEADGFVEKFGEDSPYRSFKFYGSEDKEHFSRTRSEMLQSLPLPRRFVGKIYGPKGAEVKQSWHLGNMWQANPAERWESYYGDVTHIL
jgi:hypothetical protein